MGDPTDEWPDHKPAWAGRLREAAAAKRWDAPTLSEAADLPLHNVAKYMSGGVEQPRGNAIAKLAAALDVPVAWLRDGADGAAATACSPHRITHTVAAEGRLRAIGKEGGMVDLPFPAPRDAVVAVVRGGPDTGSVAVAWGRVSDLADLVGKRAVCRLADGALVIGRVFFGRHADDWAIQTEGGPAIHDAKIVDAYPVRFLVVDPDWAAAVEAGPDTPEGT